VRVRPQSEKGKNGQGGEAASHDGVSFVVELVRWESYRLNLNGATLKGCGMTTC
jgi:hypothetical protein